jgi:hypothetical protein
MAVAYFQISPLSVAVLAYKTEGNSVFPARTVGPRAEFQTWDLPNTRQQYYLTTATLYNVLIAVEIKSTSNYLK